MAKPGSWKALGRRLLFGAALTFGGPLLAGCQPAAPASPSYEADVRPIFMSHCVRCHGAGGNLNMAKEPVEDGGVINIIPVSNCWLDQYANTGMCTSTSTASFPCRFGALTWATSELLMLIHRSDNTTIPMPPPPAPILDDWELKVVDAWVAEKPMPICSNSANPDPTICPPDAGQ
ncbi:MAG TPA: hypothetical protein VFG23_16775 [Polyangia bacterium]|nr:hypothetical protein [Polyangia bacterium]